MARDTQAPTERAEDRPTCPECGHVNIPGAAFCARCGRSLGDNGPAASEMGVETDSQATSAFEPVTSIVTPPSASPWARPGALDHDAGQTSALPTAPPFVPATEPERQVVAREPRGARGFWLGLVATLLILAVLAVYLYAAWLSDSARSTIDGWLPWG